MPKYNNAMSRPQNYSRAIKTQQNYLKISKYRWPVLPKLKETTKLNIRPGVISI